MADWTREILEFHQYITPDGIVYDFHNESKHGRWILNATGWGMPPIDFITQQGPFQHGANVRDFFLEPRIIQLLIEQEFCDRDAYWSGRNSLLDAIRPNRFYYLYRQVVAGKLRRLLSTGEIRDLDVFIQAGPEFGRQLGQWNEWGFRELLRFVAYNPVVYNPEQQTQSNWSLPNGAVDDTQDVTYEGTWEEYPTLVITGPLNNPYITNITTNQHIALTYNIPNGRVVTITLTYGAKTVTDDLGNNLIGVVTTDSDLAEFRLAPDPEAYNGVNRINIQGAGSVLNTTDFEVQWYKRYIGI